MSLGDGSDDIGRAAAGGNQANCRFLGCARVAERHIARAAFVLRIDEAHVRPFRYGIADRERRVSEHAENILDAS